MASVTHFWPSGSTVMLCGSVGGWFSMHRSDIDCPGCLDRLNKETKAVTVAEVVAASERRRASPPPSRTPREEQMVPLGAVLVAILAEEGRSMIGGITLRRAADRVRRLASPVPDAGHPTKGEP